MENLTNDVVDTSLEVLSGPVCPIKEHLPKVAVFAAVAGVAFLGWRWLKKSKAKKAASKSKEEKAPDNAGSAE